MNRARRTCDAAANNGKFERVRGFWGVRELAKFGGTFWDMTATVWGTVVAICVLTGGDGGPECRQRGNN